MAFTLLATEKNTILNSLGARYNSGTLVIYSGTAPTNADGSLSGNTVLATLNFNATAFGSASGGSIAAAAITQANATATGTATFYRAFTSGATVICQGAVSTSGAELNLNTTSIVSGGPVSVTSYSITI